MRRLLGMCLLAAAVGCDDGGAEGEVLRLDAGAADVGGAGGAGGGGGGDLLDAYCEGVGTAKCEYVFRCVQGGARNSTFGLSGPGLDDCVADQARTCIDDVRDRAARGTLREITEQEVQTCQDRMAALDCPPGSPDDWVTDFYQFIAQRCTSVGVGTVVPGGDCERRADCQDRTNLCIDGACAVPSPGDIMQDCTAASQSQGAVNPDPDCPGEVCAQPGPNDDDKAGICTADCTEGFGCPPGAYCLRTASLVGPPSWYCTWPCTSDRQCQNGFECTPINPMDEASEEHCAAAPAPEE